MCVCVCVCVCVCERERERERWGERIEAGGGGGERGEMKGGMVMGTEWKGREEIKGGGENGWGRWGEREWRGGEREWGGGGGERMEG